MLFISRSGAGRLFQTHEVNVCLNCVHFVSYCHIQSWYWYQTRRSWHGLGYNSGLVLGPATAGLDYKTVCDVSLQMLLTFLVATAVRQVRLMRTAVMRTTLCRRPNSTSLTDVVSQRSVSRRSSRHALVVHSSHSRSCSTHLLQLLLLQLPSRLLVFS